MTQRDNLKFELLTFFCDWGGDPNVLSQHSMPAVKRGLHPHTIVIFVT